MFAVSIDGIDGIYARSSPRQFAALLTDVAAASSACFGTDRTLMAHTSDAVLLIAINSANPPLAINLERRLLKTISGHDTDDGWGINISVGGPVQPQGAKAVRARIVTDRVITLAASRALDKQGRPAARLLSISRF